MTDVFTVLADDHTEVKQMLTELEAGSAGASEASVHGEDGLRLRKKMVERLIIEESKHEAVEEEYFWPAVRELLTEGDRLADRAVEQEQAAKKVLNELIGLDAGEPRFEELLANLITAGRAHIAFEETEVWPALRKVMTDERAERLGEKLERGKKLAPTRPHPNTPPKPGILKAAGPAVAAADRVRDKITGRGQD
ncbi:hemerythrin domain-containing protein [Actinomadura montaniterrae]|uniref:Hemerythrin domain-containing protein n=1 Tax=Actinomadura montaniterrae TaxID=1803903 RepID=A0A6L3VFT6_9ACTN|nr:hemerythrin domain-containing protein [Actinomadura montaniterrae]KAB2365748.1 hemerythrin domain-containing protein [Actinomadura montaniterrae]